MRGYASFGARWAALGRPELGSGRLPSVSVRYADYFLLSVQQAREHNTTATNPHVDRPVTALCSGSSLTRTVEGRNELQTPAQHHVQTCSPHGMPSKPRGSLAGAQAPPVRRRRRHGSAGRSTSIGRGRQSSRRRRGWWSGYRRPCPSSRSTDAGSATTNAEPRSPRSSSSSCSSSSSSCSSRRGGAGRRAHHPRRGRRQSF